MLNRRTLLSASTALSGFIAALSGAKAAAPKRHDFDIEPRGTSGLLERLPKAELEGLHDFLVGFRVFTNRDMAGAASERINNLLTAEGIDPKSDVPLETILEVVGDDPLVWNSVRTWLSCQQVSHQSLLRTFHANEDAYLAELEAAEQTGPGTIQLDPDLEIPEYARHEIHIQPGGYVGEAFAGHCYHYSTNNFYAGFTGNNDQDQIHRRFAASVEPPADGRVLRILDMGCGAGQLSVALKDRFPDAEIWGIDVAAPMLRYAHLRAVDLGSEVHFRQRLAESTGFPDNHFDIVSSYIMFHEVPAKISVEIAEEAHRITRPGGVFYPIDFAHRRRGYPTPFQKFRTWWDHRWNNEVWRLEFAELDFAKAIESAGFNVTVGRSRNPGFDNIIAVKS